MDTIYIHPIDETLTKKYMFPPSTTIRQATQYIKTKCPNHTCSIFQKSDTDERIYLDDTIKLPQNSKLFYSLNFVTPFFTRRKLSK